MESGDKNHPRPTTYYIDKLDRDKGNDKKEKKYKRLKFIYIYTNCL